MENGRPSVVGTSDPGGSSRGSLSAHWPLLASLALLFAVGLPCFLQATARNDGHWVYPLDDTYIHLGMAKTFATTGIWGLNQQSGFASGNSSLLYPLLLAAVYRLTGFHEITSLLVNLVFAVVLLWWIARRLREEGVSELGRFLILGSVVLLTPLVILVLIGMEHTLQTLLSIMFLFAAAEFLARPPTNPSDADRSKLTRRLIILSLLLPAIRYEALFLVSIVCLLLLWRSYWKLAFALGVVALLPAALYGWISMAHGWYPLPNSVLLKANTPLGGFNALIAFLTSGLMQLVTNPHMYALAIAAAVALVVQLVRDGASWKPPALRLVIFLALLALHMQFAKTGWFYRYEGYLIVIALVLLGMRLLDPLLRKWRVEGMRKEEALACLLLAFLVVWPASSRATQAIGTVARASTNVYEQQYQMARFLAAFYPQGKVAANDVGAITCFTNIDCLDLYGLTNKQVLRARRAGKFDTAFMARLARKRRVDIAVVYDSWFQGAAAIPKEWTKVGEWKVFNNVILGGDVVSFYAVRPEVAGDLTDKLRQFSGRLPKTIEQRGAYVSSAL